MKAENAGQALGIVMVDEFVRCGMTDACLAPGSRSTPMALALANNPSIRLHVSIDERSAGFLALGMAKKSRRPVAILTTSGTAAANLFPAVIEAHLSAVPLIVLTADRPPELRDTGAGQTIDQIKMFGGYVGWFVDAGVPEAREGSVQYWRSIACRAWGHAMEGPAGPVHLNLAFRDPLTPVRDETGFSYSLQGRGDGSPWHEFHFPRGEARHRNIDEVAAQVQSAQRGLIVTGFADWGRVEAPEIDGGAGSGTVDATSAVRLAERLGWPLLAEGTSGARIGDHAISTYDALLRHKAFAESHRPDLVIRFGSTGLSSALRQMLDKSIPQITVHNGPFVPDPGRAASRIVHADPALFCQDLSAAVKAPEETAWLQSWVDAESRARAVIDRFLDEECQVNEPRLARDLAACLANGSNLVVGSSMPVRDLDWFMAPREGLSLFSNRGANGIDGFVSTVLGIAVRSSGYTAGLCGDLSLLHDQNGLIFAANNKLDAAFVVANNNGGGIFSFLPQADDEEHFERLFGTPHNVDLEAIVKSYGIPYERLTDPAGLAGSLASASETGGVHIIEAKTDRRLNVELHRAVWQAVAEAIR